MIVAPQPTVHGFRQTIILGLDSSARTSGRSQLNFDGHTTLPTMSELSQSAPALSENAACDDPLAEMELRIARRADQLAHALGAGSDKNIEHWTQAEQEIWGTSGEN